jgi:beta-mannanase
MNEDNSQNVHRGAQLPAAPESPAAPADPAGVLTARVFIPGLQTPSSPRIYWGALVDGQAPSTTNMQPGGVFPSFESRVHKHMSILHWGQAWQMNGSYQPFYAPWFDAVRSHGSIPLLDWSSWLLNGGINQPNFTLAAIASGRHDAFIMQWAQDAKSWGHPFFLRFDWEMNGNWQFPWSEQLNNNQPGDFIKAWRHVHDIFRQAGASNVTWVWCPNISGGTTLPMASLYPGDAYVDWTCIDGYNQYTTWLSFDSIFAGSGINWLANSYQEIRALAPDKPIMIGEFASREAGDGGALKAAWVDDALSNGLPRNFPAIKAVVWFNWDFNDPNVTWPVDSSQPALNAFITAIAGSYYDGGNFSNLNTSPIPPLN